jgi:hypothetical protein
VIVTQENHVFVQTKNGEWTDAGRHTGKLSGEPARWNDQAVLPTGTTLQVLGASGFVITASAEFLTPTLIGNTLAVATTAGDVWFYNP